MRAPPLAVKTTHGKPALARALEELRDPLADDRAHRAAAEVEIHDAERERVAADRGEPADDAFGELRLLTIALELLRVRHLVSPAKRVARA